MTHARLPHAHLFRRAGSKNWWVYYRWEGKTLFRSMDTVFQLLRIHGDPSSEQDCKAALPIFQGELVRQFLGPKAKRPSAESVTLGEVADCYRRRLVEGRVSERHAEVQTARLTAMVAALGGELLPALSVDTPAVDRWLSERLKAGASPTTARNELVALKAAFRQAVADKLIGEIPFQVKAPAPRKRERTVPQEHLDKIVNACEPKKAGHRFLMIAIFTGLRTGDILGLTWGQIGEKWIEVRTGKTGAPVRIFLHPKLKEYLKESKGDGKDEEPVVGVVRANVERITERMCGTRYGAHIFRHTFLSKLMSAGVPTRVLQALAGHASPHVTLGTYAHPTDADIEAAVRALG